MASGQAQDAAENQQLLGAAITSDMDLTDMSFNDFFSFTDDVSADSRILDIKLQPYTIRERPSVLT